MTDHYHHYQEKVYATTGKIAIAVDDIVHDLSGTDTDPSFCASHGASGGKSPNTLSHRRHGR
jgi:hypothetical protein